MENNQVNIERNPTRSVKIGSIEIGAGNRIAVQSMTATKTTDIDATVELVNLMYDCLLYTSPSPRDRTRSRMPSSA